MLSGSLSVEFFVHIHDVILFNVQLRNKYDDDDEDDDTTLVYPDQTDVSFQDEFSNIKDLSKQNRLKINIICLFLDPVYQTSLRSQ